MGLQERRFLILRIPCNDYSQNNGFVIQEGEEIGTEINFSYSKSYTNTKPYLSFQLSSSNPLEAEWTYIFQNENRNETCHTQNYYLFEMNNAHHSMVMGDFDLNYNIKATF